MVQENLPAYEDVATDPEAAPMDTGMEPPVTEEPEDYTAVLAPIPPEDILLFLKDQGLIAPDVELLPLDEKMAMEEGESMSPPPFEAMMSEGETE